MIPSSELELKGQRMPTESQLMEKIHTVENQTGQHSVKIKNLETWVGDIHKSLKNVERNVTLASGAFVAIELFFKIWSK